MLIDKHNHTEYRHVLKGNVPTEYITFTTDAESLGKGFKTQLAIINRDYTLVPVEIFMDLPFTPIINLAGSESKFEGQSCINYPSSWVIQDTYDNRVKYAKMIEAQLAMVGSDSTIIMGKPLSCIPTILTNMQVQKVTTCQTRLGIVRVLTGKQITTASEEHIINLYHGT